MSTLLTDFINSPPGILAAGVALGGLIWKSFKAVGDVLKDNTNAEIGRWLLGLGEATNWRKTFQSAMDDFLGGSRFQTKGFWPLCVVLFTLALINLGVSGLPPPSPFAHGLWVMVLIFLGVASRTYSAFLGKGMVLYWFRAQSKSAVFWSTILLFAFDLICGVLFGLLVVTFYLWGDDFADWFTQPAEMFSRTMPHVTRLPFLILPFTIVSVAIVLYWTSGLIIRAAASFGPRFAWLASKFDIEKKPLQSIGVVAGALVMVVYWVGAALMSFFI